MSDEDKYSTKVWPTEIRLKSEEKVLESLFKVMIQKESMNNMPDDEGEDGRSRMQILEEISNCCWGVVRL